MRFNKSEDAMEYIAENDLENVPVTLDFHFNEKPKIEVWFGNFETGLFKVGKDEYFITIIHDITEKLMMDDNNDDVEDYMASNGYMSYLVPSEWQHEIVYSKHFFNEDL